MFSITEVKVEWFSGEVSGFMDNTSWAYLELNWKVATDKALRVW